MSYVEAETLTLSGLDRAYARALKYQERVARAKRGRR